MKKKLTEDMKAAMKSGNRTVLDVTRMIISEIKKEEIDTKKDLTNEDVVRIIKKGIKSREEAMKLYTEGNRPELAKKEEDELNFLKGYMPKQLSEAEIEKIVADTIAELAITSKKETGRLMKEIMGKYGSLVDGKQVQAAAQKKLV